MNPWIESGFRTISEWREDRPDEFADYRRWVHMRDHVRKKLGPGVPMWTYQEWQAKVAEFGRACAFCRATGVRLDADHLVGIRSPNGNHIDAMVPACIGCNSSKSNHDTEQWLAATEIEPHPLVWHYLAMFPDRVQRPMPDVNAIRQQSAEGMSQAAIARAHGMSQGHVSLILRGVVWNRVPVKRATSSGVPHGA
jgi:hypothetical protein